MTHTVKRTTFTWTEWTKLATTPPKWGWLNKGDDSWAGGSLKGALAMATGDGYHDAVPDAEALAQGLVDTISAMVNVETFTAVHDVSGSEVDVARYLNGTPECMVEAVPMRIAKAGRAVRIVVSFSYSAHISEQVVRQRGAAVMALVYILQQLQHPLEVLASDGATGHGGARYHYLVEVQRADEPVDIGRIMYAIAHPTMLRQLDFAVQDHEDASFRKTFDIPGGRGGPSDTTEEDLDEQAGTTIILPSLHSNSGWDIDSSIRWIEAQLEAIFSED